MVTMVGHMVPPGSYPVLVAEVVQEALTATGITLHKLSVDTGIPRMTLARRLKKISSFTAAELALIAPHIGMTVTEISRAAEQRTAA